MAEGQLGPNVMVAKSWTITSTQGGLGDPGEAGENPGKIKIAHGLTRKLSGSTGRSWDVHERGETSHGYRIVGAQRVPPAVTRLTVYR